MEIISLKDVLEDMERLDENRKPIKFSVTVITCDLKRDKGGRRITFSNASLNRISGRNSKTFSYRNNIRNISSPGLEYPEAIHPILITHYNGQEVRP